MMALPFIALSNLVVNETSEEKARVRAYLETLKLEPKLIYVVYNCESDCIFLSNRDESTNDNDLYLGVL